MTNAKSGTLDTGAKIQYLCTLVCGEALRHFDSFSDDVERTETLTAENIIKGLALYFPPINLLLKKNHAMLRRMRKLRGLKVRRYAARLIDFNEYLNLFPGAKLSGK